MVDGVHFADHFCVVALGVDISGKKHPLAVVEGDTENTTVEKDLFVGLRGRGLDIRGRSSSSLMGAKAHAVAALCVNLQYAGRAADSLS